MLTSLVLFMYFISYRSICMKDQLCQYLPQLVQMENGLDECGILNHMRRNTQIWKPVFASGNCYTITADEFQDNMTVNFSESQICKDAEITTFKFFSDVLTTIDAGGILMFFLQSNQVKRTPQDYINELII